MKKKQYIDSYKVLATQIRAQALKMAHRGKSCHIGSSLSIADIIAVLYGKILRLDPVRPDWARRDRFILSKGHSCAALYAVLAEQGFFHRDRLKTYYQNGSYLAGHINYPGIPGVEVSTGSLGHGLSIGCGMALVGKRDKMPYRVFVLLGDGECNEGEIWEAVLFAQQHQLDNLIAIVDYNKIQGMGSTEEVLKLEPLAKKWSAFGWQTQEINGHNFQQIEKALTSIPFRPGKPSCILARTVKGKGVSFMEDKLLWHYKVPSDQELHLALKELEEL